MADASEQQYTAAVEALLKHHHTKKKNDLLASDDHVELLISLSPKAPLPRNLKLQPIELPHGIYNTPDTEVCLITAEPQRKFKDAVAAAGIPQIKKVIDIKKLRHKFNTFEQRRKLRASFQLFLVDTAVVPFLPKILGSTFLTKKTYPIPVKMRSNAGAISGKRLAAALQCTYLYMQERTRLCNVKMGTTAMSSQQLVANLGACCKKLSELFPDKSHIVSMMVKTPSSPALTFYMQQPVPKASVKSQKQKKLQKSATKGKGEEEEDDMESEEEEEKEGRGAEGGDDDDEEEEESD
jgi:ribosome biogenesis protein UTP30